MQTSESSIPYYSIRDVSQKEIYDSYMGILRISPNKVDGKDNDDPTSILNTLVDFDGVYQGIGEQATKNSHIEVRVSDSDGNLLPIIFTPRAFSSKVYTRSLDGNVDPSVPKNLINIATKIHGEGLTYVSKNFTSRSTINLINPQQKYSQLAIALGCDKQSSTNVTECQELLVYPIEAPNDDDFFNDKNKLVVTNTDNGRLFDPTITNKSRHQQMEQNLRAQSAQWYTDNLLWAGLQPIDAQQQQVEVNGRVINYANDDNEDIPVLYTRDYVLGVYDGHSVNANNANTSVANRWLKNAQGTTNLKLKDGGRLTRLSWIRLDELIWDSLDEILKGEVRHTNGRYKNLGKQGVDDIESVLFGDESAIDLANAKAPLLGQGHQQGLVSYHAMPFHRYWFHRCRQVVHNMNYWEQKGGAGNAWSTYTGIVNGGELDTLSAAQLEGKITASTDSTVSPHHSLVKDFLLCDGKPVDFKNYPNISIKNDKLLNVDKPGRKAEPNSSDRGFDLIGAKTGVHALISKTPELYVFDEKYPRFIRALEWRNSSNDWNTDSRDRVQDLSSYHVGLPAQDSIMSKTTFIHTDNYPKPDDVDKYDTNYNLDYFENKGIDIEKGYINKCALYPYTFQYLTETIPHTHLLFSSTHGGKGTEDLSKELVHVMYRFGNENHVAIDKCLWTDEVMPTTVRGKNYLNYCFRKSSRYFDNYTPIPNAGLTFLNAEIFNPASGRHRGTIAPESDGSTNNIRKPDTIHTQNWGYYDAKNEWHDIDSNFAINSVCPSTDRLTATLAKEHQAQKYLRKQLAVKMNESEARIPISHFGKAQFGNQSVHIHWWKKKKKWYQAVFAWIVNIIITIAAIVLTIVLECISWGWATPVCAAICAAVFALWKRPKKHIMARGDTFRYNIGSYEFATFTSSKVYNEPEKYTYQCLTSLPYTETEWLGCGKITELANTAKIDSYRNMTIETGEQYYIAHNVTDRWSSYTKDGKTYHRTSDKDYITFNTETKEVITDSPYPSHLNLIPIIRL